MWNWKTQCCLTVKTDPPGIATTGSDGWHDASASAVLTAPTLGSGGCRFLSWDVDSTSKGAANLISVQMNAPHTATAHYSISVGGEWVPIDRLQMPVPWISLAVTMTMAASFIGVKRIKKRQD